MSSCISDFVAHNAHLLALPYWPSQSGLDKTDPDKGAVLALKHRTMIDTVLGLYFVKNALKREIAVPVKASFLKKEGMVAEILKELGGFPILRPTDMGYNVNNLETAKTMHRAMKMEKKVLVYCPESTRSPDMMGDRFYETPLILAMNCDANIYVVGTQYRRLPGAPCWAPFITQARFTCEQYDYSGQNRQQVAAGVKAAMARLSGLETKISASSARNN
jgi:hypothetical protein